MKNRTAGYAIVGAATIPAVYNNILRTVVKNPPIIITSLKFCLYDNTKNIKKKDNNNKLPIKNS